MEEKMCLISKVKCKESSVRPIIVNFENGVLKPGQEDKIACRLYKRNNSSIVAAATKNMIYSGEVTRNEVYNTFIAVIDKTTNKATLVALDEVRMSPWFKESKALDISLQEKASVSELNKVFGSKKVKRRTEQLQRLKLDVNNVKEQLEQTVADVEVDVSDMVAPSIESYEKDGDYKPQINRDAVKVEEIYVLKKLVSLEILRSLTEELEPMFETSEDLWGISDFVKSHIKKYQQLESNDKDEMCALLLYVDCLIKFMIVPAKTISNKKYIACSYSEIVHNDILKKFTIVTGNTRSRPNIMRDKCLCYILVLSIIACRYTLNINDISKELKLGLKKVQDVCRVLAFTVNKDIALLKLPLPAPVTSHVPKKRKM